jgi:tRNA (guanine-N7-)-methyltransferase
MSARILKDYENVSLRGDILAKPIDFGNVFGRCADVHIEIGSGRGTFLLNEAAHRPDVDFLGIEWASKYYRYAVDRIGRWQLTNVRIIRADVAAFLTEYVGNSSVACFHIYFPDPWPKKRHHRRRFVSEQNTRCMIRCLRTGGIINIATDHAGYFEQMQSVLGNEIRCQTLEPAEFIRAAGAGDNEVVGTNYEKKYINADKPIYTIAARKL